MENGKITVVLQSIPLIGFFHLLRCGTFKEHTNSF